MKAVLISISPKWCELIASGKKTVEVRKTKPKIETPFKVYIYATWNGNSREILLKKDNRLFVDRYVDYLTTADRASGKVIGEFVCKGVTYIEAGYDTNENKHLYNTAFIEHQMCIPDNELFDYLYKSRENSGGWGWHISDLVIYDKPKELREFFYACDKPKDTDCSVCLDRRENRCKSITRPPQNWCYVEELR